MPVFSSSESFALRRAGSSTSVWRTALSAAHHSLISVFPVTRETLGLHPGWQRPLPQEFQKSWRCASPDWKGAMRVVEP